MESGDGVVDVVLDALQRVVGVRGAAEVAEGVQLDGVPVRGGAAGLPRLIAFGPGVACGGGESVVLRVGAFGLTARVLLERAANACGVLPR